MRLVNLTPHVINVGNLAIAPSGAIARVASATEVVEQIFVDGNAVDIVQTKFGSPQGLPAPEEGVYFLVSSLVRLAAPERVDLLSPGEQTRDAQGRVTGCKNLTR